MKVLGPLLALGDDGLRRALCRQLVADFKRIDAGLEQDMPGQIVACAHELKGLAGTIGAGRLADMARSLHANAGQMAPVALVALVLPVRAELARAVAVLSECEQSPDA